MAHITPSTALKLLEALRDGVAKIDAANRECPVRTPRKGQPPQDRCTKCGATQKEACGLDGHSLWQLEQTVRAAIALAEQEMETDR